MYFEIEKKEFPEFTFVEFRIATPNGQVPLEEYKPALSELKEKAPAVDTTKGVIISGKGPTHCFSVLGHKYHETPWVANLEPRLMAGIVNAAHGGHYEIGDAVPIPVPEPEK